MSKYKHPTTDTLDALLGRQYGRIQGWNIKYDVAPTLEVPEEAKAFEEEFPGLTEVWQKLLGLWLSERCSRYWNARGTSDYEGLHKRLLAYLADIDGMLMSRD
jgi:hypothetical protein